jgi:hypothetical protein
MRPFLVLLFISLCFSCESKEKALILPLLEITDITVLDFTDMPIPDERSSFGTYSNSFYFTHDLLDSLGLYRYDFEEDIWESTFFPLDGPNGLKKYDDFILINDTLAIHGLKGFSSFQLVNLKSKQVETFRFSDTKMGISKLTSSSVYYDGNILGFPISYSMSNKDENYTKEVPIYGFYDIGLSKLVTSFGFPEEFQNYTFSTNFLNRDFLVVGETIHLSMHKSDFIYSFDLNGGLKKKTSVSSSYVSHVNPGIETNQIQNMISTMLGGIYSSFLYDGKYFYRSVLYVPKHLQQEDSGDLKSFMESYENARFKVIKLDKNFEIVAEGEFDGASSKKGIGDNFYFIKEGSLYYWLLDKQKEDLERFVTLE